MRKTRETWKTGEDAEDTEDTDDVGDVLHVGQSRGPRSQDPEFPAPRRGPTLAIGTWIFIGKSWHLPPTLRIAIR
jgi:hypothetical protein